MIRNLISSLVARHLRLLPIIGSLGALSVLSAPSVGFTQGVDVDYFSGRTFQSLGRSESGVEISADWGTEPPYEGASADNFSVRWRGQIIASTSGEHLFQADFDDGYRLWIADRMVIDAWSGGPTTIIGRTQLEAGRLTPIRVEFFEAGGPARASLTWRVASDVSAPFSPIPLSALSPPNQAEGLTRLGITARDPRALEGVDPARFSVYRLGDLSAALTVYLAYEGDAEEGLDYVNLPQEITLEAYRSTYDFELRRVDNQVNRGHRSLRVLLVDSEAYTLTRERSIDLTLLDDERDELDGLDETYTVAGEVSGVSVSEQVVICIEDPETSEVLQRVIQVGAGPFSFANLNAGRYRLNAWADRDMDGSQGEQEEVGVFTNLSDPSDSTAPDEQLIVELPPHQARIALAFTAQATAGEEPPIAGSDIAGSEIEAGDEVDSIGGALGGDSSPQPSAGDQADDQAGDQAGDQESDQDTEGGGDESEEQAGATAPSKPGPPEEGGCQAQQQGPALFTFWMISVTLFMILWRRRDRAVIERPSGST